MNIKKILNDLQHKYRTYSKVHGNTKLLDNTGFFEHGQVISEAKFNKRYMGRLNYGVRVATDILSPEFELNKLKILHKSIVEMLYHMGNSQLGDVIAETNLNDFQKLYESGVLDDIKDVYDTYNTVEIIEILVGKSNELRQRKYRLRKKARKILGYE